MSTQSHAALHIAVDWRVRTPWPGAPRLIERVARRGATAEGFTHGRLSVVVIGQTRMRSLHRQYLNNDAPTDVLTFDLGTHPERGYLHGDIVVCTDVARRAARRTGAARPQAPRAALKAATYELALYTLHGVLHLAGYDDHAPRDFRHMHARENELLTELGLGPVFGNEA